MVLRYRDGRSDRGYLRELAPGVVRVGILRTGAPALEAALPLAIVEAIHFVADLNQPPLQSLPGLPARPAPVGKPLEVHLARWSLKGTRVQADGQGFFLVPSDPRCNAELVFFPEGAAQLVETGDLPPPPADELDPFAGALVEASERPLTPRARVVSGAESEPPVSPPAGRLVPPRAASPAGPAPSPALPPVSLPPVSLPPLEAVVPLGSAPLLPAEVEALIAFDAPRPPGPTLGAIGFWDNPWSARTRPAPSGHAPEHLLPFPGSIDLPILPPEPEDGDEDLDIEIEEDDPAPSFAYAAGDLLDSE